MTFTQLYTRLKNFLRGWLLVLGLEEGLVECATLCVKSWVILTNLHLPMIRKCSATQVLSVQTAKQFGSNLIVN